MVIAPLHTRTDVQDDDQLFRFQAIGLCQLSYRTLLSLGNLDREAGGDHDIG